MSDSELFLRHGRRHERVPIADIQYIECDRRLRRVVTSSRVYTVSSSLQSLESQLPETDFIRIHKSYLVCARYVSAICGAEITVGGRNFRISRRLLVKVLGRFNRLN